MIKISDKLWFVKNPKTEGTLAYMCSVEENKSGGLSSATKRMQETGLSWAGLKKAEGEFGEFVENAPTKGIYVGSSVSRWSTSNKLFRVTDPRGFTVEIPTDNLATLLHHTTVINGYVQDECVWGRSGGSHILLPINSEPYLKAVSIQEKVQNDLIKVKDLKVGDIVKLYGEEKVYHFFGRVKITWNVQGVAPVSYWVRRGKEEFTDWYIITDEKYTNIFLHTDENGNDKKYAATPTSPKITEVVGNRPVDIDPTQIGWVACSKNVRDQLGEFVDTEKYYRTNSKILSVQHKGEK